MFLVYRADDGCFYVGLGSNGNKKKNGAPAEYRPFQCCPTKLEKTTRVPKMTAAKIGESAGGRKAGGNFKFASVPTKAPAAAVAKDKASAAKTKTKDKKAEAVPEKQQPLKKGAKGAAAEEAKADGKKKPSSNKQALAKANSKAAGTEKGKGQKGLFSIDLNWW